MDARKTISKSLLLCLITDENESFCNYLLPFILPSEKSSVNFRESNALIMANTSCCSLQKSCIKKELALYPYCVGKRRHVFPPLENWLSARYRVFWKPMQKKMTKTLLCKNFFWEDYSGRRSLQQLRQKAPDPFHCQTAVFPGGNLPGQRRTRSVHYPEYLFRPYKRFYYLCRRFRNHWQSGELSSTESDEDMEDIAFMLVDMLGTEAMTQAWVSYSNTADDLSSSFPMPTKKQKQLWRLGKIFEPEKKRFQLSQAWNWQADLSAPGFCVRNVYPGGIWQ